MLTLTHSTPTTVVREHYLRSDIPCGSELCQRCVPLYEALADGQLTLPNDEDDMDTKLQKRVSPVLGRKGRIIREGDSTGHYLIIDTNVALHQVRHTAGPSSPRDRLTFVRRTDGPARAFTVWRRHHNSSDGLGRSQASLVTAL